jgi:Flp pilus assembly protein TadG
MIDQLSRFIRDDRAAAIIELALVAPILATMVLGATEISAGYSARLQLEQSAQRIVEEWQGKNFDTTKIDTYKSEAATAAGVQTSAVTIDYWVECSGTRQATFDSTCTSLAVTARFATIDIQKNYTPMFSRRFLGNSTGSYTLHGKAGVRFQ